MIKLSIYKKSEKEEEAEHELKLGLDAEDGDITLICCDEDGGIDWCLLIIHPDGTFERCISLPNSIGLQVNKDGQIIERELE